MVDTVLESEWDDLARYLKVNRLGTLVIFIVGEVRKSRKAI